jgi:hypothetical protein
VRRGEGYREVDRVPVSVASVASTGPVAGTPARLKVQTLPALLDVAAGSYYVPLEQPLANLAVAALEPEAPSSFAANGVIEAVANEARVLTRPVVRTTAVP